MATTATSAALQRRQAGADAAPAGGSVTALVDQYRTDFEAVLPTHIKPDQWVRVSLGVLRRDRKLAAVARGNPGSLLSAMLDCARDGLEIGRTFHLVPFGNEVTGIRDYTGEIELIYRAGAASSVTAEVVRENDSYRFVRGKMDRPEHERPARFEPRGQLIGVYAYAVMNDGTTSHVVELNAEEVAQIRAESRVPDAPGSPWVKWTDRMWCKSAVHRLRKFVPSSAEYRGLVAAAGAAAPSERVIGALPAFRTPPPEAPATADDGEEWPPVAVPPDAP